MSEHITITIKTTTVPDTQTEPVVALRYRPIVIGIVAGEVSGDALGADFMRQMNNIRDDIVWVGVGGAQMAAQGLISVIDMSRLSVMGLVEVVAHLPDLLKARDSILKAFDEHQIDMFVGIDAPDFNLRLGKALKAKGIFSVQYVSPSVWAWREGRIEKIKQSTHLVLCLFPFELAVYQKYHHPALCVGHPLLNSIDTTLTTVPLDEQRLALMQHNRELYAFFNRLFAPVLANEKTEAFSHVIAVMPGSRVSEIKAIFPNMLGAIRQLLIVDDSLCFIIPTVGLELQILIESYLVTQSEELQARVVVSCAEDNANFSQQVMAAADLVLLASGTATLEAMLLQRPMVVVYSLNKATYWLAKKMVKIPYVALPNILAGKQIVPELIQQEANPENISRVVQQTLAPQNYNEQRQALQHTTQWLHEHSNISPANAVIDGWLRWHR